MILSQTFGFRPGIGQFSPLSTVTWRKYWRIGPIQSWRWANFKSLFKVPPQLTISSTVFLVNFGHLKTNFFNQSVNCYHFFLVDDCSKSVIRWDFSLFINFLKLFLINFGHLQTNFSNRSVNFYRFLVNDCSKSAIRWDFSLFINVLKLFLVNLPTHRCIINAFWWIFFKIGYLLGLFNI